MSTHGIGGSRRNTCESLLAPLGIRSGRYVEDETDGRDASGLLKSGIDELGFKIGTNGGGAEELLTVIPRIRLPVKDAGAEVAGSLPRWLYVSCNDELRGSVEETERGAAIAKGDDGIQGLDEGSSGDPIGVNLPIRGEVVGEAANGSTNALSDRGERWSFIRFWDCRRRGR